MIAGSNIRTLSAPMAFSQMALLTIQTPAKTNTVPNPIKTTVGFGLADINSIGIPSTSPMKPIRMLAHPYTLGLA